MGTTDWVCQACGEAHPLNLETMTEHYARCRRCGWQRPPEVEDSDDA